MPASPCANDGGLRDWQQSLSRQTGKEYNTDQRENTQCLKNTKPIKCINVIKLRVVYRAKEANEHCLNRSGRNSQNRSHLSWAYKNEWDHSRRKKREEHANKRNSLSKGTYPLGQEGAIGRDVNGVIWEDLAAWYDWNIEVAVAGGTQALGHEGSWMQCQVGFY